MSNFLKSITSSYLLLCILYTQSMDATWSEPSRISANSSDLSLAMGYSGNAMAVWNGCLGTTANNLFYNYIKMGKRWYATLQLSDTQERALMSPPSIAMDANSNVVVVWEEFSFVGEKSTTIKARMLPSPGKWSPIVEISKSEGAGRDPHVAINSSGYAVAVWKDWDQSDSPSVIKAATYKFGKSWSAPVNIGFGEGVQVKVDDAGNAVAVWYDNTFIKSASLPFGGSWSTPTVLSTEKASNRFALGMNPSGYAVVVWLDLKETAPSSINATTMSFGEPWTEVVEIDSIASALTSDHFKIVVDSLNRAIVVWQQETLDLSMAFPIPNDRFIQASRLLANGKWTKPKRVSAQGPSLSSSPDIGIDIEGNATVVWSENGVIQTASHPVKGSWSEPANVTTYAGNSVPHIAVDSSEYAVIVWINDSGSIQSSVFSATNN